jgi:hypothetical protein
MDLEKVIYVHSLIPDKIAEFLTFGIYRLTQLNMMLYIYLSNKYITSYLVVLDGITYTLLYCYQHNGMDSNECIIKFGIYGNHFTLKGYCFPYLV